MANLTSTTITGTLNTTSTITGPASGASALNASNVSSGTLASDRLPTVPTTKGGTGLTSIGSADQVLKVNSGGTALEFGEAGGGGNYVKRYYTSPATWTKPADIQAVQVTVLGAGGNGGPNNPNASGGWGGGGGYSEEYIAAPAIPGPVSVSAGPGTNSFGAFLSATAGQNGGQGQMVGQDGTYGSHGAGSGGQININTGPNPTDTFKSFGFFRKPIPGTPNQQIPGDGFGGGATNGRNGTPGIVMVEEYY